MDESGLRMAAHAAHKAGQKEFEFLGKKYPVKVTEDGKVDCNYAKVKDIAKKEVRGHEKAMHEQTIDERELSAGETKKKEHIVKSMKKNLSGFKSRYGDKAKSVMYATATKQAKKEEADSSNEIVNSRQKQYNQAEEYELHLDLTEGEKMDGKKKVVKKESMMGAAPSNATGMGESRGHKIIADKLRQIASKSHGVSPDMSTTAQNIKDRLKDAKNLSRVEIVNQKDTSVKEATDTETKDASGKVTSWQHTGDWKKSTGSSAERGKGKVAHLSDFARKKTTKMANEESEELDEISADLVGRYSDKASKEYNDPKTSEHKKATRRAGLMTGYNKAKGRARVPATYSEEIQIVEAEDSFEHGRETLSYGVGTHPEVAKELHKHAGKIQAIFHNTKDNAMAAVVHNTEDGVHGDHHVLHFINNKKVHTTIHPTFGDAEAHGVKTVTTKKGLAHLNKMHGLMKEEAEELDELSKGTLSSYVKGAATDLPRLGNTLGRLQTHGKLKDTEKRIGSHIAKRYRGIERATDKLAKEDSKSPGQDEDNHMSPGATARN